MGRRSTRSVDGEGTAAAVQTSAQTGVVVCTMGGLSVCAGENGRTFAPGDELDLGIEVAPGVTWGDAIGAHVDTHFAPKGVDSSAPQGAEGE